MDDEDLEECGQDELYGIMPQIEPLWADKVRRVKDRLEEVYRTDRDEFYVRKKLIEQAIRERERGIQETIPNLTLDELQDVLKFTERLYG